MSAAKIQKGDWGSGIGEWGVGCRNESAASSGVDEEMSHGKSPDNGCCEKRSGLASARPAGDGEWGAGCPRKSAALSGVDEEMQQAVAVAFLRARSSAACLGVRPGVGVSSMSAGMTVKGSPSSLK